MAKPTCSVEGCDRPQWAKGFCGSHLKRWKRHGDPLAGRVTGPASTRLWAAVDKDGPVPDYAPHLGPCWLWTASGVAGYGTIMGDDGKKALAHRLAYEFEVGPIPEGLELDHLCRVRACVNPAHLEPVTRVENQRRIPPRTHCIYGHEFTPENTYVAKKGNRQCRACMVRYSRERKRQERIEREARGESKRRLRSDATWTLDGERQRAAVMDALEPEDVAA